MPMKEEDFAFNDALKVEFKDMLEKFLEPRDYFHAYSISRMCTHAIMIGFDYGYFTVPNDDIHVGKVLDLKEYGKIEFMIDCRTNYGIIASSDSNAIINKFLTDYPTTSTVTSYTSKLT